MDRDAFNISLIRYPQRQCLVAKPAIYSIYTNHYIIIIYHDNDYNYVYYQQDYSERRNGSSFAGLHL